MSTSVSKSYELPLEIVEEFTNLLRVGEPVTVSEFLHRHPDFAGELREILSAVAIVEMVGLEQDIDKLVASRFRSHEWIPRQLGDFQLGREIGRGGMGIVFEAEQLSLNRRVAIKVLSNFSFDNPVYRQRFEREARAAGRLHHTNIVPVIAVGETDQLAYYAMPLIEGLGLDIVIQQIIKRLADKQTSQRFQEIEKDCKNPKDNRENAPSELASYLMHGLLTGRLELLSDRTATAEKLNDGNEQSPSISDERIVGKSAYHRRIQTGSYCRSVARLVIQAAEALHYAHEQGFVHRDIKPANLILDRRGSVWITDFGLTKSDEQTDLTKPDDLLGTLRYMAPERFAGIADAKSDVYALGLTLYELLALRYAFDAIDRSKLIKQVSSSSPARLQSIVPTLPIDLVNITHKAIAPDPQDRYSSAAELANDLRRFLIDEPIHARRETVFRKGARWCRKNPVVATLSAFLSILVVCLVIVQRQVRIERDNYRGSLFDSLVSQAQFQRLTGQAGQRVKSLQRIAEATAIGTHELLDEEAIRALVLMDIEPVSQWPGGHSSFAVDGAALSPEHREYVAFTPNTVQVREVPVSGGMHGRLLWEWPRPTGTPHAAKFSPDGRTLGVCFDDGQLGKRFLLWKWKLGLAAIEINGVAERAFDINQNCQLLACGVQEGDEWYLRVSHLQNNEVLVYTKLPAKPFDLRFEPHGTRVAITIPSVGRVLVYNAANGRLVHDMNYGEDIYAVAWSPSADALAVGRGFDVEIANVGNPDHPIMVLPGHTWMVHAIDFHPDGHLLVSHSLREGTTRLWDLRRRRQVLTAPGHSISFDSSGRTLAFSQGNSLSLQRLCGEGEYRAYATSVTQQPGVWRTLIHPQLPLLVTCGSSGIHCWDVVTGSLVSSANEGNTYTICFDSASGNLLSAGELGLRSRQIHRNTSGEVTISEASELNFGAGIDQIPEREAYAIHVNRDGTVWAAAFRKEEFLYVWDKLANAVRKLVCGANTAFIGLSPDGRWLAGGNFEQPGFRVWDLQNEGQSQPLAVEGSAAQVFFSPNGQFLITCSNDRYTLFDVGTWNKRLEILTEQIVEGAATFSEDSRTLAICMGHGDVRLIRTLDGTQRLRLDGKLDQLNVLNLQFGAGKNAQQLYMSCGPAGIRRWDLDAVQQLLISHRLAP